MGVVLDGERLDLAPLLADLIKRDARWLDARAVAVMEDDATVLLRAPEASAFEPWLAPSRPSSVRCWSCYRTFVP